MVDPVALFFAMSTQWRWVGAGLAGAFRVGLDYQAIEPTAAGNQIKMTPAIWEDIRTLERAALAYWNERRH